MVEIKEKNKCCGCTACSQICPHTCITMEEDEQGFLYPKVNKDTCIDCHLCENVCPVINRYEAKVSPIHSFLAKTKDEAIRAESSSGGIFTELARFVLGNGGVVFGVRFDEYWKTVYGYTETEEGVAAFRGSKYVQADMNSAYREVQQFLKSGRQVLFTGTPCFVSGLNHFLRKKYDNLLTMDVVCHSILSTKVWLKYLNEEEQKRQQSICHVTFRDKSLGWTRYSLRIDFKDLHGRVESMVESHFDNSFMRGMTYDLFSRPSCSDCPARNYTSGSDLTVADAWDINKYHPDKNDEKGISHVLVNTKKGYQVIMSLMSRMDCSEIDYHEVEPFSMHAPLTRSCKHSPYRDAFYDKIGKGFPVSKTADYYNNRYAFDEKIRQSFFYKAICKICKCIKL